MRSGKEDFFACAIAATVVVRCCMKRQTSQKTNRIMYIGDESVFRGMLLLVIPLTA